MCSASEKNVSGTWLGNYYYTTTRQPSAFEAVFVQSGTALEGSILDDNYLGEAHLSGSCASGELTFCKIYNSKARHPVYYRGSLSEDGQSIFGTWRIDNSCSGSWKAWRLDDEKLPETMETDDTVEQERELAPQLVPQLVPVRRRK